MKPWLAARALLALLFLLGTASPVTAGHLAEGRRTRGIEPVSHSPARARYSTGNANSDVAFWGDLAFHGRYDGFRVIDISQPGNPRQLSRVACHGGQGDVAVWDTLLFRAVDRPQTRSGCGGQDTASGVPGFEGIQIFRISDPSEPRFVKAVPVDCGAHTMTLVPQPSRDRVLLYVSSSHPGFFGHSPFGNHCQATHGRIPIVSVPIDRPRTARVIRSFAIAHGHHCHDIAVHRGVDRAAGACWPRANVWDISRPVYPQFLFARTVRGVEGWHSASFTWDGKVIVLGWEPGGGSEPECQRSDPVVERSVFFFGTRTGRQLGKWTLRRFQTASENCTIHDFNVVPVADRYVLVTGNYQAGTSVVDFTDPETPRKIGFSDPPPLSPTQVGGAWASYWYNGYVYESDITRGLNIFRLPDTLVAGQATLTALNPQTQQRVEPVPAGMVTAIRVGG
ncbi:MAG: LVIVD repeat-containing protein [Actinomycetota bacterium]